MQRGKARYIWLISLATASCAYRFTNLHLKPPAGAKTIAIEAIYDTSKNVIPHESLWESLQRQFAIDGRLHLSPQSQADIYLRAHITHIAQDPANVTGSKALEPRGFIDSKGAASGKPAQPFPLSAYPTYLRTPTFAKSETVAMTVEVEVWDLRKQQKLLQKAYVSSALYNLYDGSTPPEYTFLQVEENFEKVLAERFDDVAKQVVRDCLSL